MANLRDEIRGNDARDASVDMKLEIGLIAHTFAMLLSLATMSRW